MSSARDRRIAAFYLEARLRHEGLTVAWAVDDPAEETLVIGEARIRALDRGRYEFVGPHDAATNQLRGLLKNQPVPTSFAGTMVDVFAGTEENLAYIRGAREAWGTAQLASRE